MTNGKTLRLSRKLENPNLIRNNKNSIILFPFKVNKQCGAEEARRAHNPEVVGSKPTAAIFFSRLSSVGITCFLREPVTI